MPKNPKQNSSIINQYNSLRYDSVMFPDQWLTNFAFCFSYFPSDEHGRWTKNLNILWELFVEEQPFENEKPFLKGGDAGLYQHYQALAERKKRLSQEAVAKLWGITPNTLAKQIDRLQNCLLVHRVFREDLTGNAFDIVIHTPPTRKQFHEQGIKEIIKKRLEMNTAREMLRKGMTEVICIQTLRNGEKKEITKKIPSQNNFRESCPSIDMREIRALFHLDEARSNRLDEIARRRVLHRYRQPDKLSDLFIRIVFDALKQFYLYFKNNEDEYGNKSYQERQEEFKMILANFCTNEKVLKIVAKLTNGEYFDFTMRHSERWHAAFQLAYHYAPGIFRPAIY